MPKQIVKGRAGTKPAPSKKKLAVIATGAVLCAIAVIILCLYAFGTDNTSKMTVGTQEYEFFAQIKRTEIIAYFYNKYGVDLGAGDARWDEVYEGERPSDLLHRQTLEVIAQDAALRALANQYHVKPFATFDTLQKELVAFNAARKDQLANSEVIYGPEQYDFYNYYSYQRSACETELVGTIIEDAIQNKSDELQLRYLNMEAKDFTRDFIVSLTAYGIDPEEFEASPEKAQAALALIEQAIAQGEDLSTDDLSQRSGLLVFEKKMEWNTKAVSKSDDYVQRLLSNTVDSASKGYFRAPLSANTEYECVFQINTLDYGEKPAFENAVFQVAALYANEVYDAEIARLTQEALRG